MLYVIAIVGRFIKRLNRCWSVYPFINSIANRFVRLLDLDSLIGISTASNAVNVVVRFRVLPGCIKGVGINDPGETNRSFSNYKPFAGLGFCQFLAEDTNIEISNPNVERMKACT